MLRTRLLSGLLLVFSLALLGCEETPDYPVTPAIEFKSVKAERSTLSGGTPVNRIFITLAYQDGDGDLGLSAEDRARPPFNEFGSPYYNNYHIKLFWFNNTTQRFVEYRGPNNTTPDPFSSIFEPMLPSGKPQPIRGELTFEPNKGNGFAIGLVPFRPGNRLKFEIFIYDRALNKSNVITTDELILP